MTTQDIQKPPPALWIISQIFPRLLGILFIFTAIQKIRLSTAMRATLLFDHIPEKMISPTLWLIIAVEIGLGILLLIWPRRQVIFASMILLTLYTLQIIYLLIMHNAPSCGCLTGVIAFQNARRANFLSLARNLLLLLASWLTWLTIARWSTPREVQQ